MSDATSTAVSPVRIHALSPSPATSTAQGPQGDGGKPETGPGKDSRDELRDLVMQLGRKAEGLAAHDPVLVERIERVMRNMAAPNAVANAEFRTRVAYVAQDVQKAGFPLAMSPAMRGEMAALAATYPGLRNERMQALVEGTAGIANRGLVHEIRSEARTIARQQDQVTPEAASRIDALEARVRQGKGVGSTLDQQGTPQRQAAEMAAPRGTTAAAAQIQPPAAQVPPIPPQGAGPAPQQRGRVTLDVMRAVREPNPGGLSGAPAPWDAQLTPLGNRLAQFTAGLRANDEERGFRAAEKAGRVALDATREFQEGPGAVLMARVRAAARADPDGMQGVLAGMRPGGAHADLRQDFNAAMAKEQGFAAAYEKAAGAVAKYGTSRSGVEQVAAGRIDTATVLGRFQALDADIGRAVSALPGKEDGKSMIKELGEKAAQIVLKAAEAVVEVFNRLRPGAGAGASPSAGPS